MKTIKNSEKIRDASSLSNLRSLIYDTECTKIELKRTDSNAQSAVIDELGEWNGGKRMERPRAPRDWTREAYPTGNGNDDGKFGLA